MRRRKVLVGIGALTAGGAAAFGTEAFSTAQAERNVDVAVAGDQNAFVAIQPMSSKNAGKYVSTEADNTVELNFDEDNSGSGQGINQDGITDFEDLFRVINQGSQTTSVYFEDDSDAVTFRVTRSTDTETTGSTGQSLEGADNSVELDVGEQVIVGLTVDTLNNDVSGQLLDSVTLFAEAGAAAPKQSIPQPQYVVDGNGADPNTFKDLSSALGSSDVSSGSVIGIKATSSISESSQISVDDSVTIVGVDGTSIIDVTGHTSDGGAIQITADDVTLRNFELQYSGQSDTATNAIEATDLSGLTIDGLTIDNNGYRSENPAINAEGVNSLTIMDNTVTDGNIGISHSDSSSETITVSGNYVNANSGGGNTVSEGIFLGDETGGDISNKQFEIKNNLIENSASGSADIKVGPSSNLAGGVNGQTGKQAQLESLLTENDISRAQVDDGTASDGTLVTSALDAFGSVQSAVDTATTDGVAVVESGSYTESVTVDTAGLTLKGINDPVIDASNKDRGLHIKADGITVNGLTVDSAGSGVSSGEVEGIFIGNSSGFSDTGEPITVKDVTVTNVDGVGSGKTTEGIHIKHYDAGDAIADVDISNVTIDGVDAPSGSWGDGGRGANGIKLQAGISDIDITDTEIKNISGGWGYGTVLTPSGDESGTPTDVSFDGVNISYIEASAPTLDSVGVGVDSNDGDPTSNSSNVADPDELSFAATTIKSVDVGLLNKNTNKTLSAPSEVTFVSASTEVSNPE